MIYFYLPSFEIFQNYQVKPSPPKKSGKHVALRDESLTPFKCLLCPESPYCSGYGRMTLHLALFLCKCLMFLQGGCPWGGLASALSMPNCSLKNTLLGGTAVTEAQVSILEWLACLFVLRQAIHMSLRPASNSGSPCLCPSTGIIHVYHHTRPDTNDKWQKARTGYLLHIHKGERQGGSRNLNVSCSLLSGRLIS